MSFIHKYDRLNLSIIFTMKLSAYYKSPFATVFGSAGRVLSAACSSTQAFSQKFSRFLILYRNRPNFIVKISNQTFYIKGYLSVSFCTIALASGILSSPPLTINAIAPAI